MQFWAAGIVCIYVGIGLFNWVTGLHWLTEFSLPLSILAGVGLAIASTPLTTLSAPTDNTPLVEPLVETQTTAASPHPDQNTNQTPIVQTTPAPSSAKPTQPDPSSISFTIHKNSRP